MATCPNCGYCKECGRSNPAQQPFPIQPEPYAPSWYCYRCGRTHGMYEYCPAPWITYTTTTVPFT